MKPKRDQCHGHTPHLQKGSHTTSTKGAAPKRPTLAWNKIQFVTQCQQCQSVDPAPATHTPGELGVQEAWSRLAIDVTHYAGRPYLSMVDCGPGRFVVWRELKGETATEICHELDGLFYERGPVDELLMDNALAFRSQEMLQLMEKWV